MLKKSILLVDDEETIREGIGWWLGKRKFQVTTAVSGEDAVKCLQAGRYDLVITDMVMAGVDGLEVLKQAKRLYPNTGVIILTGYSDIDTAITTLKLGADDYLQKPCDLDDLLNKVNRSLEKQDLIAQLKEKNTILVREIASREKFEIRLRDAHANLERLVAERTAELNKTVNKLKTACKTLQAKEKELQDANLELHDINTTLGIMLKRRDREHGEIKKEIASEVAELVLPLLKKAQQKGGGIGRGYLETAQLNLQSIFSRHSSVSVLAGAKLAPRELQVVHYIRQNKSSKEMAALLHLSVRTVDSYRGKIREKLGIKNKNKNLRKLITYLS